MYVGGLIGCKGDAYTGEGALCEQETRGVHIWQAQALAEAGVEFLMAGIMPTLPEAAGMARAMSETDLPYLVSFTIQRDGKLMDGTTIHNVHIDSVARTKPTFYMTNCVHPSIVREALARPWNRTAAVRERFQGVQANTSPLPYAQLDGAAELHCTDPRAGTRNGVVGAGDGSEDLRRLLWDRWPLFG